MEKAKELRTTQELVEDILINSRGARNSDNILILETYQRLLSDKGMDITTMTAPMLFANIKNLGLPTMETIRRTRQKLQSKHLYLCSDKVVAEAREELQEVFRQYANE